MSCFCGNPSNGLFVICMMCDEVVCSVECMGLIADSHFCNIVRFPLYKRLNWRPKTDKYGLRYTLYRSGFNHGAYADSLLRKYILNIMPGVRIRELPALLLIEPDVRTVYDLEEHVSSRRKLMNRSEGVEFCKKHDLNVEVRDSPDVLTVLVIPRHGPGHVMHVSR